MIKVTQTALDKLVSLQTDKYKRVLRVSVIGGGCSGLSYQLDWVADAETTHKDKLVLSDPLTIVVDPKSALFLNGMELDFSDGLNGKGFVFNNPGAKSCGCGSSFSV